MEMQEKSTVRQMDFATEISETLGIDLPDIQTKESIGEFISDNVDEFYQIRREIRAEQYKNGKPFVLKHSWSLEEEYNGDEVLRLNPET